MTGAARTTINSLVGLSEATVVFVVIVKFEIRAADTYVRIPSLDTESDARSLTLEAEKLHLHTRFNSFSSQAFPARDTSLSFVCIKCTPERAIIF